MRRRIVGLVLCVIASACGHKEPPPKEPTTCPAPKLAMSISATEHSNVGADGKGRPVQVRVYLLKSDNRLQTARFEDMLENQASVLADDLLKVDEYTLYPGETKAVPVAQNAEAHAVAAAAFFRQPQGKRWFISFDLDSSAKATTPCPPPTRKISVQLDRMQIAEGQGAEAPSNDRKGE